MRRDVIGVMVFAGVMAADVSGQCRLGRFEEVWFDDFNAPALDTTHWTAVASDWHGNNEQQYYTPTAVTIAGGELVITARKQTMNGWPYTSGLVDTRGKFAQQYGRWEIVAKTPRTQGHWPAIWLLPDSGAWPPEIDIMELLGHDTDTVYMTNHWGIYPNNQNQSTAFSGPDFSQTYNSFACEWYPDRIDFFVNGVLRARHTSNVPHVPMYLIINSAVGGYWPGYPDATTVFPQTFNIKSVQAWRYIQPDQTLANAGFESGVTGWTKWGNSYSDTLKPRTGARSGKMYGNFTGQPNSTGFQQQIAATPGTNYAMSGWWINVLSDRMQPGNVAEMRLEFYNAQNVKVGGKTVKTLDSATPVDTYKWFEAEATAPAGTVAARAVCYFYQPGLNAGAAFFDDILFGPVPCPEFKRRAAQPLP